LARISIVIGFSAWEVGPQKSVRVHRRVVLQTQSELDGLLEKLDRSGNPQLPHRVDDLPRGERYVDVSLPVTMAQPEEKSLFTWVGPNSRDERTAQHILRKRVNQHIRNAVNENWRPTFVLEIDGSQAYGRARMRVLRVEYPETNFEPTMDVDRVAEQIHLDTPALLYGIIRSGKRGLSRECDFYSVTAVTPRLLDIGKIIEEQTAFSFTDIPKLAVQKIQQYARQQNVELSDDYKGIYFIGMTAERGSLSYIQRDLRKPQNICLGVYKREREYVDNVQSVIEAIAERQQLFSGKPISIVEIDSKNVEVHDII